MPTATEWLNILELTGQIVLIPPNFESFGKRIIKSPKLYFVEDRWWRNQRLGGRGRSGCCQRSPGKRS